MLRENFSNLFKKLFIFVFIALVFASAMLFTACGDTYSEMKLTLSNGGKDVVLYLGGNEAERTTTLTASVQCADNISKEVIVNSENDKISITTTFNRDGTTSIVLNANGVCRDVPVTVQTKEGGKKITFYVSVEIPVQSVIETADNSQLFVVKGTPKELNSEKLLSVTPINSTQDEFSFKILGEYPAGVEIVDGVLYVPENYSNNTIQIQATSIFDEEIQTPITLNVINPITQEINFEAFYANTSTQIDLNSKIEIAKNISDKNYITFNLSLPSESALIITPYILSSLSQTAETASFTHYTHSYVSGIVSYSFTLSAETKNALDAFYFEIEYADFEYKIQTKLFNFETYDAVTQLSVNVDGKSPENFVFEVYDNYIGRAGMEIVADVFPTTVPTAEKTIVLKLGTNATSYTFKKLVSNTSQDESAYVEDIIFVNGEYEFTSGEKFFVQASSALAGEAVFTLYSKSNPEIYKQFLLNSKEGASDLSFAGGEIINNTTCYYLTSNEKYQTQINFFVNNALSKDIEVYVSGKSFVLASDVRKGAEENQYYVLLESVEGASDEIGSLTISLANGLTATASVETFAYLEENSISLSVPNAQYDASIGQKTILDNKVIRGEEYNLEFSVAIHNGEATNLSITANASFRTEFYFYDKLLGEGSAYDENYVNFSVFNESASNPANYFASSSVLRSLYLSSFGTLNAINVGKTWVKASISGYALENGIKQTKTYDYYFLVEAYNPVKTFALSKSSLLLYSKNSVGDSNIKDTYATISLNVNKDATYNAISWTSDYAVLNENSMTYSLNDEDIFKFTVLENDEIQVEAFSTLTSRQDGGQTIFEYANSLSFNFLASYTEFGVKYPINLNVKIEKAKQVEKIIVENLNAEKGIYLELNYNNQDITYPIVAYASSSANHTPLNPNLVYTFLPDGATPSNIISLNSETGLITIKANQITGGTGVIRIAPADRFINSVYVAGEKDIAVYIKLVVADGQNRDTSYRITSLSEITSPLLHYTLLNSASIIKEEQGYALMEEFKGGLYGALKGATHFSTIQTNKTLFKTLAEGAIVEDLIIVGEISSSYGAFIANQNFGTIRNVSIETLDIAGQFKPSTLTLLSANVGEDVVSFVGGLVGENYGLLENVFFSGKILADMFTLGGVAGLNAGIILGAKVEFYNFPDGYSSLTGGAYVGGVAGEMRSGSILNSYVFSYVYSMQETEKNYLNLNVLNGVFVGGLVGYLSGGQIDVSFAEVNDLTALVGHSLGQTAEILNAYIIFRTSNTSFDATYYVNGEISNPSNIQTNSVWHSAENGVNNGYPYFNGMLVVTSAPVVGNSLANLDNIISIDGASVVFYHTTSTTLSKQEQSALIDLNTISFEKLLGISSASGLRALSSNSNIINTYSNGIILNGTGTVSLTILSKYDYTIQKTFTLYVIYPIKNFVLNYNETEFSSGATISTKINDNLAIFGKTQTSVLLVNREVNVITNSLSLNFENFNEFIVGSGLGGYVINTGDLFTQTGLAEFVFDFNLGLKELEKDYITTTAEQDLNAINEILNNATQGAFTLKLYKGADKIEISDKEITIEPNDSLSFETTIFSDIDYREYEFGEMLYASVSEKDSGEELKLLSQSLTDDGEVLTLTYGKNENAMLALNIEYLSSIYYLSALDLTNQTLNPLEAVYFGHKFKITMLVCDEFKNHSFNFTKYNITLAPTSSIYNSTLYPAQIIQTNFELTIKSQSVLSVDATHFALAGQVMRVVNNENVVFNQYNMQANSVLMPAQEGMLQIDVFPIFASYEYLTVTYSVRSGDTENGKLRLALLEKQLDGSFVKNNQGYIALENGVKILNSYDKTGISSINSIYLSTFVSEQITKDTVFTLTITAFDENDSQNGVCAQFNLVVQYLQGAEIKILNENGEEVNALVRGGTEKIYITVDREQSLSGLNILGYEQTADANNYISYSKFTETINEEKNTKTYEATLYIGTGIILENNSNYLTFEASVDWMINGKIQTKTTSLNVGVIDFDINSISLKSDKLDKTIFNAYIGVQTALNFDFNVRDFLTEITGQNIALETFLAESYYKSASGLSVYGDYVVNYGHENAESLIGNLYYVNGSSTLQVLNANGTFAPNDYFTFQTDGETIKIVGKRVGAVQMLLSLPIKYPHFNKNNVQVLNFYFTVNVEVYSDEDTPLIIDDEEGFIDALNASSPQNYILMSDIYLLNHTPQNTTGILSLDGNNHTIHILSFNSSTQDNSLRLALFNNISQNTTLKNIIVNTYHASQVSIDTTVKKSIDLAGFAIKNEGVIYNSHVVAFESDYSKPNLTAPQGLNLSYSMGQIDQTITSNIAGFVIENTGSITNSRVGGEYVEYATAGNIALDPFNIAGQGNMAGFVLTNSGSISSSFASNITITNKTSSGTQTFSAGFAGTNSGDIQLSYVEGTGDKNAFSLAGAGISTASISAGFAYSNGSTGVIEDCYSNILLATENNATQSQYQSGRLTSGFVYNNAGTIERAYTASKIENAKTTQMNFIGVDNFGEMQNSGTIANSYYYTTYNNLDDAYASTSEKINVSRITEPDLQTNFYGFSFAESALSLNGVWRITSTGPSLVSANQIAVSNRYITDAKRDAQTGELVSYKLPYSSGFEYGSVKNPIIIRNATEFNKVFGGDDLNAGTAISSYYDLTSKRVFGNYRIVNNINLSQLLTDTSSGVKINSSNMSLYGGRLDGNMFTLEGLELVAKIENENVKDYGMFAKLENDAIIMNLEIEVVAVNAVTIQNVGAVAGIIENSKVINLSLYSQENSLNSGIVGNNIVGGVAGVVCGESTLKNINIDNISVTANAVGSGTSQRFNRDETLNNRVNSNVSYAGSVAGVADMYASSEKGNLEHSSRLTVESLGFITVKGNFEISASTVGGVLGYLGPQTLMKEVTLELGTSKNQKLIAYNFSAGGIVGQCYGDMDMIRAQHEKALQSTIENNVSNYYSNPSANIERGNLNLFQHNETDKYAPENIGGLVGELITGNISHAYSKLQVRNSNAENAGGIIGKISYAQNSANNNINIFEVYTFSDVYARGAVGGFAGFIDQTRTLSFDKVNMVNYWSLTKGQTGEFEIPAHYYDIYAKTGTKNLSARFVGDLVTEAGSSITLKEEFSSYRLPVIAQEVHSDDVYAMNFVEFSSNGSLTQNAVKQSYASLGSENYFKIINTDIGAIQPLKNYVNGQISGSEMDAYFRNSDWDANFWKRYQNDMLPSLVSNAKLNIFYIYTAKDLQNMVNYPDATFIVVGQNENGMVKVGNYIRSTGLFIDNFSGVLRGYDNSGEYGFDFEGYSLTFINSATAGAKIYNLNIKNLGSSSGEYIEGEGSFVGSSIGANFENLTFEDCALYALATTDFYNIGLLSGHITGGYISNITFKDCSIDVLVGSNLNEINLGLMAGRITTPVDNYMQIGDVSAYKDGTNINSEVSSNRLTINTNTYTINNVNTGVIAGTTDGSVLLNYTSKSANSDITKGIGVADTTSIVFSPDSDSGQTNGFVIRADGGGIIKNYNAGLGFGSANVMNLSYQRPDSALKFVGAIQNVGANIENSSVGGYIGKSLTSSIITNGAGQIGNYMYVDCDINLEANSVSAGMLVGESNKIYALENVDTYGTIKVKSKQTASFIGGIIGKATSDLSIGKCISRTAIDFADTKTNYSSIGGLIGYVSTPSSKILIGNDNFKTQYLGTMRIEAVNVMAGGIVGSFASSNTLTLAETTGAEIISAVFGGEIIVDGISEAYIGGIVGSSNYQEHSGEAKKVIDTCFAYGNIKINADFDANQNPTYIGGILGKGSSKTEVNSNFSISTIYTKHTATQTKLNINALVGVSNGAVAGQDLAGNTLTNFYSHQLSLCLDNSGVDNENIYYYTQNENTSTTMVEVVQAYIESLSWKDKQNLAYQGSKINPIVLNSQTFEEEKEHFASNEGFSSTKYFVIAEDMPQNMMQNITLVNSFIVGDGFSITNTERGVFAKIDSDSTVSGVAVKANITTNTATYASKNNVSYYGTSALCDINEGYIYSSNVNEVHSEKTYGKNGLDITSTSVFAGGVAGVNFGQISDCYSNIDINSKSNAGAFAGLNLGIISHSYANGSVTSENGKTADAFAKSTTGGVYYSYTVAKVYNTAGSVFGAESEAKVVNCYYDIYATNTSSTTATQLITDKMAVFDSQNILSDEDSNNVNEQTGEVSPKLFLANSQKADDTAPIKFAYNFAYNNGYPTFMGSGYENLTYMHSCKTGDGSTENNAIEIPHIGKLQQIDDFATTSNIHFALTENIEFTETMKNIAHADENISKWNAIGKINPFKGTLNGAYVTNGNPATYSIKNLNYVGVTDYVGVFAETEGTALNPVKLKNIKVEYQIASQKISAQNVGGLVAVANTTELDNISVVNANFDFTSSGELYMGAIAGKLEGKSSLTNSSATAPNLIASGSGSGGKAVIGGLVGSAEANGQTLSIKSSNVLNSLSIDYKSSATSYLGGLVGNLEGANSLNLLQIENCELPTDATFNVKTSSSGAENYIAGLAGSAEYANFKDITFNSNTNFTLTSNSTNYAGTLIASVTNCAFENVNAGSSQNIEIYSTGTVYAGSVFGKIVSNASDLSFDWDDITLPSLSNVKVLTPVTRDESGKITSYSSATAGVSYIGALAGASYGVDYDSTFTSVSNIALTYTANGTAYIGSLAGVIDDDGQNIEVSGSLTLSSNKFNLDSAGEVILGGVAGKLSGGAEINNMNVSFNSESIKFSKLKGEDESASASYEASKLKVGGLVGEINNSDITSSSGTNSCPTITLNADGFNEIYLGGAVAIANGYSIIENCSVPSLLLENATITGNAYVGGVVAQANGSTEVSSCEVEGFNVGGVAINSDAYIGGVAGKISGTPSFEDIDIASGSISIKKAKNAYLGGAFGEIAYNSNQTISNIDSSASIKYDALGQSSSAVCAGGFAGKAVQATLESVTGGGSVSVINQTSVAGKTDIGGLIGNADNITISSGGVSSFEGVYGDGTFDGQTENSKGILNLGGLIGNANSVIINPQTNKVTVSNSKLINAKIDDLQNKIFSTNDNDAKVGGIIGNSNSTTITNVALVNSLVVNGSIKQNSNVSTGGIVGFSQTGATITGASTDANSKIYAYSAGAGIVGAGIVSAISNCSNSADINVGLNYITILIGEQTPKLSDATCNFANTNTPVAGGIVSILNGGSITLSKNTGKINAGFIERRFEAGDKPTKVWDNLINWSVGRAETYTKPNSSASAESYAGGIVGQSFAGVTIDRCENYGEITAEARQTLYMKCSDSRNIKQNIYPFGVEISFIEWDFGVHKIYSSFVREPAYSNGISYVGDASVVITLCYNDATIIGGASMGMNWIAQSPDSERGLESEELEMHLLVTGNRYVNGVNKGPFNTFYYLYGRNEKLRVEVEGMDWPMLGVIQRSLSENENVVEEKGSDVNVYFANAICNIYKHVADGYIAFYDGYERLEKYDGVLITLQNTTYCTYSENTVVKGMQEFPFVFSEGVVPSISHSEDFLSALLRFAILEDNLVELVRIVLFGDPVFNDSNPDIRYMPYRLNDKFYISGNIPSVYQGEKPFSDEIQT